MLLCCCCVGVVSWLDRSDPRHHAPPHKLRHYLVYTELGNTQYKVGILSCTQYTCKWYRLCDVGCCAVAVALSSLKLTSTVVSLCVLSSKFLLVRCDVRMLFRCVDGFGVSGWKQTARCGARDGHVGRLGCAMISAATTPMTQGAGTDCGHLCGMCLL